MIVDLNVDKNRDIFRRAWSEHVVEKYNIQEGDPIYSVEHSRRVWLEEFGCEMTYGKCDGKYGFVKARFIDEENFTAFLLRFT